MNIKVTLNKINSHKILSFITLSIIFWFNFIADYSFAANNEATNKISITEDPVQFLHSKIDKVLTELKATNIKEDNSKDIIKIVDNFIMPNVDFNEMCQRIAGRSIWAKANKADQEAFIKELKNLLIKTYIVTLKNYSEEKIEFQNYTGKLNAKRIQIKSTVIRPNKENLSVDYRLVAFDNSWKVYDLIIEGVSILNGFNAQFSDDIRMNGLKFVTNKIKDRNKNNVKK